MKTFVKIFRGKISHERIDTYVNLVLKTLDPDDYQRKVNKKTPFYY